MTPADCKQCERIFMADRLLQAEVRHVAVQSGASAARDVLNEALASQHDDHLGEGNPE